MSGNTKRILVVDDEDLNRDILNEYLQDAGFTVFSASNGLEAIAQLTENSPIDAIVLDRMMPVMDGMSFMATLNGLEKYRDIPVIMQTAAGSPEQIMEGIAAGVFYYLTKPYEKVTLLTILNSALEQRTGRRVAANELNSYRNAMHFMQQSSFSFKTLDEARDIAITIAAAFPKPEKVLFGLNELMVNAIEHGNLGITCEGKKKLLVENNWQSEVERRLRMPEYKDRFATITFTYNPEFLEVVITDMGDGFDYAQYMQFNASRLLDPNGRGIAMSKMYSFSEIEFRGKGNEVACRVKI